MGDSVSAQEGFSYLDQEPTAISCISMLKYTDMGTLRVVSLPF